MTCIPEPEHQQVCITLSDEIREFMQKKFNEAGEKGLCTFCCLEAAIVALISAHYNGYDVDEDVPSLVDMFRSIEQKIEMIPVSSVRVQ